MYTRERREAQERAHSAHYEKFENAYLEYLRTKLQQHEAERTPLFKALEREEAERIQVLGRTRHNASRDMLTEQYLSSRLERFKQFLVLQDGHDVLDFWTWDQNMNPKPFEGTT